MKKLKSSDLRYGLDAVLAEVRNRALEEAAVKCEKMLLPYYAPQILRDMKSEVYPGGRWVGIGGRGKRQPKDVAADQASYPTILQVLDEEGQ